MEGDVDTLQNPKNNKWYVLATIFGQSTRSVFNGEHIDLHLKNRRAWNAWMCQDLSQSERERLCAEQKLNPNDLAILQADEFDDIERRFQEAFKYNTSWRDASPPSPHEVVRFKDLHFESNLHLDGFIFPQEVFFENCEAKAISLNSSLLHRGVHLRKSNVRVALSARSTTIKGNLTVDECEISQFNLSKTTTGEQVKFDQCGIGMTLIRAAHFQKGAVFENVVFREVADFSRSEFHQILIFKEASFLGDVNFQSAKFFGPALLSKARFNKYPPYFTACVPHGDMRFNTSYDYWPSPTTENAEDGRLCYMWLRRIASDNQDTDLEHFFLRQEMRCKEKLSRGIEQFTFILFRTHILQVSR